MEKVIVAFLNWVHKQVELGNLQDFHWIWNHKINWSLSENNCLNCRNYINISDDMQLVC